MSGVRVQFLGSGDTFGSGGRLQTCIHVQSGESQFLLDCGASSLPAIKREGLDISSIGTVLVTHLHGDHFGGIPFLVLDAQLASRRTQPLVLAGPPGLERRVYEAMEALFPGSSRTHWRFDLKFVELAEEKASEIGALTVTSYGVVHPSGAPAYALRVGCGGREISYSGDTEWTEALIRASRGADLFICEAYFFEKSVRYHLDYRTLMEHREELGCERLVLTHMSKDMLLRREEADAELAEDGKCIVL